MLQATIQTLANEDITIGSDFLSNVFLAGEMDNCVLVANLRVNNGDMDGAIEVYRKHEELRQVQKALFPDKVESVTDFNEDIIYHIQNI